MKRTLCLAASCLSLLVSARADLDLDTNGLGDVWEAKYKPAVLTPGADDDHDGRTNLEECEAGTDPFSAEDIFAVKEIHAAGANLVLSWPSQAGKRYQLQITSTPGTPASWQPIPGIYSGTGTTLEVSTPLPTASGAFYRVIAADVDTDNDGLTDWEEIAAGFDPLVDHQTSCGCGEDCNCADCHCGGTELERLTAGLQSTPIVSIGVEDEDATEPPTNPTGIVLADNASFKIKRRAGIGRVVVNLSTAGTASAGDYQAIPSTLVIPMGTRELLVSVNPLADSLAESDESVTMSVGSGPTYTLGSTTSASVLIHDRVQANGTGLAALFWKHPENIAERPYLPPAPTTVPPTAPEAAPTISRVDATVNYNNTVAAWPGPPITSGTTSNYFSSRWTGEIAPEFSQAYTIYFNANESSRVMLNGQVLWNRWPAKPVPANAFALWDEWPNRVANAQGEISAVVSLEAGKRYPIVIEHYQNTGGHVAILSWASQSQPKQPIPTTRMFPNTAPRILGPYEALAFVGDPVGFQYQINASGSPTSYAASNLPAELTLGSNGLISGTLTTPGTWHILLTATNAYGSGSAFLDLTVLGTSGGITRELWTGVSGNSVSQIPLATSPTGTSTVLTSLQAPSNAGDNYGVRIRGFITAPLAGDYKFYLRADEAAEFYLSDDEEPVNAWKRAELTTPVTAADWSGAAPSPLLRLEAGKRYYVELRHKEGTGDDHLALGWVRPDQAEGSTPTIIPGHLLTKYEDVALGTSNDGTLYFTSLTPQPGAVTNAYGSCLLRLSTDKKTAWVTPNYTGLGSDFFAMHVHDTRLPSTSNIVFDLDEPGVEILADGTRVWHIVDVASLTAEQIADGLSQYAYLNVHSVMYQNGEIKGFFKPLNGSSSFTAPPAPPDWTTESAAANTSASGAARMLQQATFGASSADITALQGAASFDAWINAEFAKPATKHLPYVEQLRVANDPITRDLVGDYTFNSWWKNSITADDQLRQRVAFALSEIMVVSENGPLDDRADALSDYYDTLLENAFGNARSLLEAVTLHPAMGRYLDMLRNDKPSLTAGRIPNENYAREILQLFSLGLYRVHPDGSLILNSKGVPIPTYGQDDIIGMAHVFTGWDYNYAGAYRTGFGAGANWVDPMREVPSRHFTGRKRILNNVVLPGLTTAGGAPLDPNASPSAAAQADPAFQGLPAQELAAVHDQIFNHPNFGPFLCRQLIQRLVTSTPSRGYIYRVVSKFNDNGSGVRGDMKTVIKAILLDYEARSAIAAGATGYGKQREPVIRVTQFARAFRPATSLTGTYSQDGGVITVNTSPVLHGMASGQTLDLAFSGPSALSTDGSYSLSGTFAPTATAFSVRAKDVYRSTWAQSGNVITVTTPAAHPFTVGEPVYIRFRTGGAGVLVNGVYPVATVPNTTHFTITAADSATRSGDHDTAWLSGTFTQTYTAATDPATTTLTAYFTTQPALAVDDKVQIQFTPETPGDPVPPAGTYTVTSVPNAQPPRVTLKPDSGTQSILDGVVGTFHAAPLAPVLSRGGTAADIATTGFANWGVNGTDTDLGQTPLRASTVFNFYEPDYQFPGTLAANGLITPEFQISSDTNVLRQANFMFGGIYSSGTDVNTGSSSGFNTFRRGEGDIAMHFGTWIGLRTATPGDYWTNDGNLRPLIQEFSKILMAGQMSQTMEDQIYGFVSNTSNIAYTAATPTDAQRRERVRGILHLIAVSPELAIQR
ncbi:DUF1800 family protein [Haloferula sp. BvORR071]|uniref:DUF1800 family protein n=1 Tax=Haloferula sp. BvORR071 TaxID=1396141 RepID=UPI0006978C5C|nr:DUF1800 family protein [Haloferula sp. BvORR071]